MMTSKFTKNGKLHCNVLVDGLTLTRLDRKGARTATRRARHIRDKPQKPQR